MSNNAFYNSSSSQGLTYLEFGAIDQANSKKEVYDFKLHQKAYDWFMLARYTNDMLAIRKMIELFAQKNFLEFQTTFNEIHHKNELCLGLGKLAALYSVCDKADISFFELGQTIFGCIDSISLGLLLINNKVLDLKEIDWVGLDISETFNELAKVFYHQYKINTSSKRGGLPDTYDMFYSKGVTLLYAITEIDQLYNFIVGSRSAYFDYSFSLGEGSVKTIGTGKTVHYFSFKDFLDSYRLYLADKEIYINANTSKIISDSKQIWLEFFITDSGGGGAQNFYLLKMMFLKP